MNEIEPIGPRRIFSKEQAAQRQEETSSQFNAADLLTMIQNLRAGLEAFIPVAPPQQPSSSPTSDPRTLSLMMQQSETLRASSQADVNPMQPQISKSGRTGFSSVDAFRALMSEIQQNQKKAPEIPTDRSELSDKANEILERRAKRREATAGETVVSSGAGGAAASFLGQTAEGGPRRRVLRNPGFGADTTGNNGAPAANGPVIDNTTLIPNNPISAVS